MGSTTADEQRVITTLENNQGQLWHATLSRRVELSPEQLATTLETLAALGVVTLRPKQGDVQIVLNNLRVAELRARQSLSRWWR